MPVDENTFSATATKTRFLWILGILLHDALCCVCQKLEVQDNVQSQNNAMLLCFFHAHVCRQWQVMLAEHTLYTYTDVFKLEHKTTMLLRCFNHWISLDHASSTWHTIAGGFRKVRSSASSFAVTSMEPQISSMSICWWKECVWFDAACLAWAATCWTSWEIP